MAHTGTHLMIRAVLTRLAIGTLLSFAAALPVATQANDIEFDEVVASLSNWQDLAPPTTGTYSYRFVDKGRVKKAGLKNWYCNGQYLFARTRVQQQDSASEYILFDNGGYFASIVKGDPTLSKWVVQSLALASEESYAVQKTDTWPNNIGVTDILGGKGAGRGVVEKLTKAPIKSATVSIVELKGGLEGRRLDVIFDGTQKWNGHQPPQSLVLFVARAYDWLPVKTIETRADGIVATAIIDGWHEAEGRWLWTTCNGYVGTETPDPAKLVMEIQLGPGKPAAEFDTDQCYLSYYGIPEPNQSIWSSKRGTIVVVIFIGGAVLLAWVWWRKRRAV